MIEHRCLLLFYNNIHTISCLLDCDLPPTSSQDVYGCLFETVFIPLLLDAMIMILCLFVCMSDVCMRERFSDRERKCPSLVDILLCC
jgi:hypothetical protein